MSAAGRQEAASGRIISDRQRSLAFYQSPPSVTQEWNMIASILEANPAVSERVWEDLTASRHGGPKKSAGAKGMTAEQVLRFAVVKMKGPSDARAVSRPSARGARARLPRAAKKAFFRIHNTRGQDQKKPLYKKLIHMAKRTVGYGCQALEELARGVKDLVFVAPKHKSLPELIKKRELTSNCANGGPGSRASSPRANAPLAWTAAPGRASNPSRPTSKLAVLAFNLQTLARHLLA